MTTELVAAPLTRRLTAVLLADVVGYSRMMSDDEDAAHTRLMVHVRELIDPTVAKYQGRPVRRMGDGMLIEFASALDAVHCALDIQRGLVVRQVNQPDRIQLRIGINTGDVLVDERDIYGNSVNITARLEALAAPGTTCVSQSIYDQTRGQPDLFFADRGMHRAKNIPHSIRVFEAAYEPIRISRFRRVLTPQAGWTAAGAIASVAFALGMLNFGEPPRVERTNSIIVLPFRNVEGNSEDNYLADAITVEVTTELSRLRRAWVIASGTALTYKDKPTDVRQIGREIGVRYALEGSVRRTGAVVHVNTQLIDTQTGTNLWANRFLYETTSLFDLQDAVIGRIAISLKDEVIRDEVRHEVGTLAGDGNPLDERLRTMSATAGILTPQKSLEARSHADAGLQKNPTDAKLLAELADILVSDYLNSWNNAGLAEVTRAELLADKAISLDRNIALAHYAKGFVRRVQGHHNEALVFFKEAARLNPSFAAAYAQMANELVFLGSPSEAIDAADKAARLSPKDRSIGVFRFVQGRAYFALRDYQNASRWLAESVQLRPNLWFSQAWLIAAYALSGQSQQAQAALSAFQKDFPKYDLARITAYHEQVQFRGDESKLGSAIAALIEGLRKAGLK